jgi:hypothetical protein
MIPKAGYSDFPAGSGNFPAGYCRKPPKIGRIWKQKYDTHIRRPVMFGSNRLPPETEKTDHRISAPMFWLEPVSFDLEMKDTIYSRRGYSQ